MQFVVGVADIHSCDSKTPCLCRQGNREGEGGRRLVQRVHKRRCGLAKYSRESSFSAFECKEWGCCTLCEPAQLGTKILRICPLEIYNSDEMQVKIFSVCGRVCCLSLGRVLKIKVGSHLLQTSQVSTILGSCIRVVCCIIFVQKGTRIAICGNISLVIIALTLCY